MFVRFRAKTIHEMDIDPCEAFRILCETLDMNCTILDNSSMYVKKSEVDGENKVYQKVQDRYELFDDRGDLFIALRNLAECLG